MLGGKSAWALYIVPQQELGPQAFRVLRFRQGKAVERREMGENDSIVNIAGVALSG